MTVHHRKYDPNVNYYEILDVSYTATGTEITRAYRDLMRHAHPDRFAGERERARAEERAKMLNVAYSVLGKPAVRREYDHAIRKKAVSDAVFQRYTGNAPGRHGLHQQHVQRSFNPRTRRAKDRANRSALIQVMVIAAICTVLAIILIIGFSLLAQGVDWLM